MGEVYKRFREESKHDYGEKIDEKYRLCNDQLKLGALLRIADSLERMETPYVALLRDYENVKRDRNDTEAENVRLGHVISGLRGALKRAKEGGKK